MAAAGENAFWYDKALVLSGTPLIITYKNEHHFCKFYHKDKKGTAPMQIQCYPGEERVM